MSTGPKGYADLADLPEDQRIQIIGRQAEQGGRIGFVVDDDVKADRYINKLTSQFPVEVVKRGVGPVADTVLIVITRRSDG